MANYKGNCDDQSSKIVTYRHAIETRLYPEERTINDLIQEHMNFKVKCEKYGVEYFEIDKDYDKEMAGIYDYIERRRRQIERIKKR